MTVDLITALIGPVDGPDDLAPHRTGFVSSTSPLKVDLGAGRETPVTYAAYVPAIGEQVIVGRMARGYAILAGTSTPWTAPTLGNSWVDFLAGVVPTGYRRHSGMVELRGAIKSGTVAATAFTLPAGFRPAGGIRIFSVLADPGAARLDIGTDGTVTVRSYYASGSNAMVSLSGVSFSIS